MQQTKQRTFDAAEAAVARLLLNGRAFVQSTKVLAMVQEMADDAEVKIEVIRGMTHGWWVKLA